MHKNLKVSIMSKYSKLYTFGCSFTNYHDFKNWPEYIGQKLNLEVYNFGKGGNSNQQIFRSIISELSKVKSDNTLVIVGLSELLRISISSYTLMNLRAMDSDLPNTIKSYLCDIIGIKCFLENNNFDYKIFSAMNPIPNTINQIDYCKEFFSSNLYDIIDNKNILGLPFFDHIGGMTFEKFAKDRKMTVKDDPHPNEQAHELWADWLIEKL